MLFSLRFFCGICSMTGNFFLGKYQLLHVVTSLLSMETRFDLIVESAILILI